MSDHIETNAGHRDVSLDRMLFFSDGVFAIAITLLSIELRPPENWDGTIAGLWFGSWRMLSAFAVSFMVIGAFWNGHRRIFARMAKFSGGVAFLNLLLLLFIALVPFATSLIYEHGPRGETLALYLMVVTAAGLLQALLYGWGAYVAKALEPTVSNAHKRLMLVTLAFMPLISAAMSLAAVRSSSMLTLGLVVVAAACLAILRRRISRIT